jgi:hypothetical protein
VVFAGVRPPHFPLKTVYFRVRTSKGDPRDAVFSSGRGAADSARTLLTQIQKSLE